MQEGDVGIHTPGSIRECVVVNFALYTCTCYMMYVCAVLVILSVLQTYKLIEQ